MILRRGVNKQGRKVGNRVQKGLPVSDDAIAMLHRQKLIEGRKPNLFVAKKVGRTLIKRLNIRNIKD